MTKTITAAVLAALAMAAPAQASAPPKLWISEAKLAQKRLAYKITPSIEHDRRVLGPCVRDARLSVHCSVDFFDTETDGKETIKTKRTFKVVVVRTAIKSGYRTASSIAQTSFREDA